MNKNMAYLSLNLLFTLLNPIVGLMINLLSLNYRKIKIKILLLLSFNISLIITYLPIMADTKYNYQIKNFLKKIFSDNYYKIPINFTYLKVILTLEKIGFDYMQVIMFYIFLSLLFCFGSYYLISKGKDNIYIYTYIFYATVLCNLSGFNRYNLAILIINLAIFCKNKLIKYTLFLISYYLHQSTIVLLLIYIINVKKFYIYID